MLLIWSERTPRYILQESISFVLLLVLLLPSLSTSNETNKNIINKRAANELQTDEEKDVYKSKIRYLPETKKLTEPVIVSNSHIQPLLTYKYRLLQQPSAYHTVASSYAYPTYVSAPAPQVYYQPQIQQGKIRTISINDIFSKTYTLEEIKDYTTAL